VPETWPAGYHTRSTPYTFSEGGMQIAAMYLDHPTIFGANTGRVSSFNALDVPNSLSRGKPLTPGDVGTKGEGLVCLVKAGLTAGTPGLVGGLKQLPEAAVNFLGKTVMPMFDQFSCR